MAAEAPRPLPSACVRQLFNEAKIIWPIRVYTSIELNKITKEIIKAALETDRNFRGRKV